MDITLYIRYVLEITLIIPLHLTEAISTKLFGQGGGQFKCHHGLSDHGRGRHGADVRSLHARLEWFLGQKINAFKRRIQSGYRFHGHSHHNGLAITDAPFDTTAIVGLAIKKSLALIIEDLIMNFRTKRSCSLKPHADLFSLHGLNAHQGEGEPRIEPSVPLAVAAKSRRYSCHDDLKYTTECIAFPFSLFDLLDHLVAGRRIGTSDL